MIKADLDSSSINIKEKSQIIFLFFWTTIVGCYVVAEWIFNQHLLQVMEIENISLEGFNKTIFLGKIVLSIGIGLIIKGICQYKQWWKFLAGIFISFIVISVLYRQIVEDFPPELVYASHYGILNKKNAINLKDEKKILELKEDGWYVKPILLSHFILTLGNKDWLEFQNRITEPVSREVSLFLKNKSKHFESYNKAETERKDLEKKWNDVLDAKAKYEKVRYSKAKKVERKIALDIFRAKTGIEPSVNQEEFFKNNSKDLNKLLTVQIFAGHKGANIPPIYIRDIPKNLNEEEFFKYVEEQAQGIKSRITPSMREIRNARKTPAIVKHLALPPIMMAMSLGSMLLNILILIGMWINYSIKNSNISSKTIMPIYFALSIFLLSVAVILKEPLTSEYKYWNESEKKLSTKYPELAIFWKFGLKLEPMVCLTKESPKFVERLTKRIYR